MRDARDLAPVTTQYSSIHEVCDKRDADFVYFAVQASWLAVVLRIHIFRLKWWDAMAPRRKSGRRNIADAESAETLIFGFVHICMRAEVRVTSARMVFTEDSAHSL